MQKAVLVFIFCVLLNEVSPKVTIDKDQLTNKKKALAKQLGPHVPKWAELASYAKEPKSTQNKSKSLLNLLKVVTAKEIGVPNNSSIGDIIIKNATLDNIANNITQVDKNVNETINAGTKATNGTTFPKLANSITNKGNATVNKTKKKYLANETIGGKLASMKLNVTTEKPKLPDIIPPTMIPIFKPMQTSPRNAPILSNDLIRQDIPEDINQQQTKPLDSNATNFNTLQRNDVRNENSQIIRENRTIEMPSNTQNKMIQNDNARPIHYNTTENNNKTLFVDNFQNSNKNSPLNNGIIQMPKILTEKEMNLILNSMTQLLNSNNVKSVQNGNLFHKNAVRNSIPQNNIVSSQQNAFKQEQNGINSSKDNSLNIVNSIPNDQIQNMFNAANTYLNQNSFITNNPTQNEFNPINLKSNEFAENGTTRNPRNPNENALNPGSPDRNGFNANIPNLNGVNGANTNQNGIDLTHLRYNAIIENEFNPGGLNENGFNSRNTNENGLNPRNPSQFGFVPNNINLEQNGLIISNQNVGFNPNTFQPNQNGLRGDNLNENILFSVPGLSNTDQTAHNALKTNQNLANPRNANQNEFNAIAASITQNEFNPNTIQPNQNGLNGDKINENILFSVSGLSNTDQIAYNALKTHQNSANPRNDNYELIPVAASLSQSKFPEDNFNFHQIGFILNNGKHIQEEFVQSNNNINQNGLNSNSFHQGKFAGDKNNMNMVQNGLNINDPNIGNNVRSQHNMNGELSPLNNNLNLQQSLNSYDVINVLNAAKYVTKNAKPDNNFKFTPNEATNGLNTQFGPDKDVSLNIFSTENMRLPPNPETLRQTVDAITKPNSNTKASRFSLPCLKASDVLGDLYQSNVQITKPILDPVTEVPRSKLQHQKPKTDEKDEESVAIVFKPKNISLLKFYGDLLKKITLTVLVPYHISTLTDAETQ